MGILDLFGKKDVATDLGRQLPYRISTEFVPYKLRANSRGNTTLKVNLKNMTQEPVISSVVVQVPERISLDSTGIAKEKEVRLGTLAPGESKDAKIDLFSGEGTDKGEYTVTISAFIHYRDYAHVLNAMKKRTTVEAV
ncbi:MAG: hypothetical protein M1569_01565 [Candidatus Marsarchaeota archaeon]|nr:hypothetical protein [Candidatus Marsarchaeota archaeon]MCL5413071.1 hypothetical protein [Candidatus Marsarchaeota archaeon]